MSLYQRVVFMDRDGTMNADEKGYISCPEDYSLFPYTAKAVRLLKEAGFGVIVITNQSGIARGIFTLGQLEMVHVKLREQLADKQASVDEILISPYHEGGVVVPFNISHPDRKPGLGLFYKALQQYHFLPQQSYMIGDKADDIEFGNKAGMTSILVQTGYGKDGWKNHTKWEYQPAYIVPDLLSAAKLILFIDKKSQE